MPWIILIIIFKKMNNYKVCLFILIMSICINPFNCPLKKCNKVHHFKRKFKTTLNLCENFNQCNDYHNCIKYHPERPIFNEKISYMKNNDKYIFTDEEDL